MTTGAARQHNVVSLLAAAAARTPDRAALVFQERSGARAISFAELWDRVDRVSSGLRQAGLAAGDRAILMVPMSISLYTVMLGVLKLGGVAVFVDPWIGRRQVAAFSAFAGPTAFIGIGKSHLLRLLHPELRAIRVSVSTGRCCFGVPARHGLAELAKEAGDGNICATTADDPALITFTTGSSGKPKGANRSHGFLAAQHRALQHEFPYRDEDVDMPMFPVFALNNLAGGITSVIPQMDFQRVAEVDADVILAQMQQQRVTTCTASPPFFDRLVARLHRDGIQLPALRRLLTGGAPVTDEQLEVWQRALPDCRIEVVYGSTEAEPVAHLSAAERLGVKSSEFPRTPGFCTGQPTRLLQTRIIRIHDGPVTLGPAGWREWELPQGRIGELVVCGDHVCRDYYRSPEAVKANKILDPDGCTWHRMGDTGYFDDAGRFWLVGRVHSTIHRGDELLHPQLIEQVACKDTRVLRAAALGMPAASGSQRAVLVLESRGRDATLAADLKAQLAARGLIVDSVVVRRDPLPVDPRHNAKIDYHKVRAWLART